LNARLAVGTQPILFGEIGSTQTFLAWAAYLRDGRRKLYEADTRSWYYDPTQLNPARV